MSRLNTRSLATLTTTTLALAALLLLPAIAVADNHEDSDVAAQVKAQIIKDNAYNRENLMDSEGGIAMDGSMEFWSSGGLMNTVAPDSPPTHYESFSIHPKHIKVIELPGGKSAVAMYYAEGSMQVKGGPAVSHYMTRVLQVYVHEDGEWKVRAAHWSPIAGGAGTSQSSID